MTEAIYCVKETSLTCCGKGYRIGNVKESKRLEEHICRVHILEGDGDWFNEAYSVGKCTPANTAVPYNFRTQGLLCGYCERGNNQGKYFKPQSMGNHIVQSCQKHVPLQVRDEFKLFCKKRNRQYNSKTNKEHQEERRMKRIFSNAKYRKDFEFLFEMMKKKRNAC